ncbi:hypothetical protein ACEWY4_024558 [Coilia grayii]|uniref:BESS domain-containing protein n=1 Tax=Coilia grayii TaxID=363190 RepID=A0ABD1J0N7_9TELE
MSAKRPLRGFLQRPASLLISHPSVSHLSIPEQLPPLQEQPGVVQAPGTSLSFLQICWWSRLLFWAQADGPLLLLPPGNGLLLLPIAPAPVFAEVKRKWRDLRDTYVKSRRAEQERQKSGAAASQKRPWRYAGIMSFLAPYVTPRKTTSNFPAQLDQEREGGGGEVNEQEVEEDGGVCEGEVDHRPVSPPPEEGEADRPGVGPGTGSGPGPSVAREQQSPWRERRRRRQAAMSPTSFESRVFAAIDAANAAPAPERDADQLFLDSLHPALQRLSPQQKALTKLKIHQLIYEAEFQCEYFVVNVLLTVLLRLNI